MAFDEYDSENRIFHAVGTRPVRPDGIDKVTGKAQFGADFSAPGMLHGAVLRSPHAHARIKSIDTSKAEALPEVKAVITRADFNDKVGRANADVLENVMAGEKALYDGHAVAAVAATSALAAKRALRLIDVDYEVLPHVTDVDAAMAPGAPELRPGVRAGLQRGQGPGRYRSTIRGAGCEHDHSRALATGFARVGCDRSACGKPEAGHADCWSHR